MHVHVTVTKIWSGWGNMLVLIKYFRKYTCNLSEVTAEFLNTEPRPVLPKLDQVL